MRFFLPVAALFLLSSALSGCATPNAEVTNVNSKQYGNASLRYNSEEVRVHQVDGKPFQQPSIKQMFIGGVPDTYIKSGKHQIDASLHYVSYGYVTMTMRDPTVKSICFNAEAGKTYSAGANLIFQKGFKGMFKRPDWELKVVEFNSIRNMRSIGYSCK